MCGVNKNNRFKDFLFRLKAKRINKNIYKYFVLILIIYDIFYLINYFKKSNKNNIYNILWVF